MKVPRPCLICNVPTTNGPRCPQHTPKKWAGANTSMPSGWTKTRREQLQREPNCRVCGAPATEADHVINRAAGGGPLIQSLCKRCHAEKTAREGAAARKAARRRGGPGGDA
jgi:5-methylcytosine-specific restriction enzyme A